MNATKYIKRMFVRRTPPLAGAGGAAEILWQMCVKVVEGRGACLASVLRPSGGL